MREEETKPNTNNKYNLALSRKTAATALALVVVGVGGFALGTRVDTKTKEPVESMSPNQDSRQPANGFGSGRGMNGQRGAVGKVTAVSSTSITVQNARSGSDEVFTITTNTKVTNAGQIANISSVKVNDTVMIQPSTSNAKEAGTIVLNPQMGNGQQMPSDPTNVNPT